MEALTQRAVLMYYRFLFKHSHSLASDCFRNIFLSEINFLGAVNVGACFECSCGRMKGKQHEQRVLPSSVVRVSGEEGPEGKPRKLRGPECRARRCRAGCIAGRAARIDAQHNTRQRAASCPAGGKDRRAIGVRSADRALVLLPTFCWYVGSLRQWFEVWPFSA